VVTGLLNNPTGFYRSAVLDIDSLNYLNCYLEILPYGIRASVFGKENDTILCFYEKQGLLSPLRNYEDAFNEILKSFKLKSSDFSKVSIVVNTEQVVFIPDTLFDKNGLKEMLKLNFPEEEIQEVVDYKCKTLNSHLVFSLPENLSIEAIRVFPNIKFFHFSSVLVEKCMSEDLSKVGMSSFCLLYLNQQDFTLLIRKNDKLLFHNIFKIKAPEDVLYFLTYALKEVGVELEDIQILIAGSLDKEEELKKLFSTYVPNFSHWVGKTKIPKEIKGNYQSAFVNLHLYLCE